MPGTIFGLAFQTSNFAALLNFLETQGELQVLSSPRIATINNQKAVLKVGTDEFFVTNVTTNQTTTTGGAIQNSPSITTQPFFSGVALDVTPQIDENNQIILHIHPSVSNVVNKTTDIDLGQAGVFTLPLASSTVSETDTIVRVTNGNIVAIGGLMKQSDSAQPRAGARAERHPDHRARVQEHQPQRAQERAGDPAQAHRDRERGQLEAGAFEDATQPRPRLAPRRVRALLEGRGSAEQGSDNGSGQPSAAQAVNARSWTTRRS